jgi:transcriptional regulator with GAF, ATPase, and Fis domain
MGNKNKMPSIICVPIRIGAEVIGALSLDRAAADRAKFIGCCKTEWET